MKEIPKRGQTPLAPAKSWRGFFLFSADLLYCPQKENDERAPLRFHLEILCAEIYESLVRFLFVFYGLLSAQPTKERKIQS